MKIDTLGGVLRFALFLVCIACCFVACLLEVFCCVGLFVFSLAAVWSSALVVRLCSCGSFVVLCFAACLVAWLRLAAFGVLSVWRYVD